MKWNLEYTDTFGGEANYCWVKRESIPHQDGASDLALVRRFKRALGISGMLGRSNFMGDSWEFRPYGSCTIAFATFDDSEAE